MIFTLSFDFVIINILVVGALKALEIEKNALSLNVNWGTAESSGTNVVWQKGRQEQTFRCDWLGLGMLPGPVKINWHTSWEVSTLLCRVLTPSNKQLVSLSSYGSLHTSSFTIFFHSLKDSGHLYRGLKRQNIKAQDENARQAEWRGDSYATNVPGQTWLNCHQVFKLKSEILSNLNTLSCNEWMCAHQILKVFSEQAYAAQPMFFCSWKPG